MDRNLPELGLAALSLALSGIICWILAGHVADRMVQHDLRAAVGAEQMVADAVVDNIAQAITTDITWSRALPATIARMDDVTLTLARTLRLPGLHDAQLARRRAALLTLPRLQRLNGALRDAQQYAGLSAIWAVNASVICVAVSKLERGAALLGGDLRRFCRNKAVLASQCGFDRTPYIARV